MAKLFNITATEVTSSTRASWSNADVNAFEHFIADNNGGSNGPLVPSEADISTLLAALGLSRFTSTLNVNSESLGPIIEAKVRRKLAAVLSIVQRGEGATLNNATAPPTRLLPLSPPQPPPNGRTRLQAARADALAAGKEPPTRLAGPKTIYTPEPWHDKRRRTRTTSPRVLASRAQLTTAAQIRQHIAGLEKELGEARARLRKLELGDPEMEGQDGGGGGGYSDDHGLAGHDDEESGEDYSDDSVNDLAPTHALPTLKTLRASSSGWSHDGSTTPDGQDPSTGTDPKTNATPVPMSTMQARTRAPAKGQQNNKQMLMQTQVVDTGFSPSAFQESKAVCAAKERLDSAGKMDDRRSAVTGPSPTHSKSDSATAPLTASMSFDDGDNENNDTDDTDDTDGYLTKLSSYLSGRYASE